MNEIVCFNMCSKLVYYTKILFLALYDIARFLPACPPCDEKCWHPPQLIECPEGPFACDNANVKAFIGDYGNHQFDPINLEVIVFELLW